MTLIEQVYTQAHLMARELPEENQSMLEAVCAASVNALKLRLRENMTPEDCLSDFVSAAAMYAVAAMAEVGSMAQLEQVTAGDLTLRRSSGNSAVSCLRYQAEMLMKPYLREPFVFVGV